MTQHEQEIYEQGEWNMFRIITSCEYGKECYFLQDDGTVYSRRSCKYMTKMEAINEFVSAMEWM